MAARAFWKGTIRFGKISVPVKLYSAVEDRNVHFKLLHRKDQVPVQQKMIHAATGQPVPTEQIRRGFEIEPGRIVILDNDELESLVPEESRDILISHFVDPSRINHQWYERPYYMGPDGDRMAYFALAEALQREKKEGVAQWVMRRKTYFGALHADRGYLKMITLRRADEIVDISGLSVPKTRELSDQELQMAGQLVAALEQNFEPAAFHDEYRERVLDLIKTKASGKTPQFEKPVERKPEMISLSDMLKQSIQQARKERKIA